MVKKQAVSILTVTVAFLATTMSVERSVEGQTSGKKAPPTPVGITGTWEAAKQPKGPWLFILEAKGDVLTGGVWQEGGLIGPAEIRDGRINGDVLTFKYRPPRDPSRVEVAFPDLISSLASRFVPSAAKRPNLELTITLNGVIEKDEIHFQTRVTDPNGTLVTRPAVQIGGISMGGVFGLFDPHIAEQFSVKRAVAAVIGRVVVEDGLPRPVFRFQLVNAAGKRFDPLTRGNTWEGATGSAFDVAPRSPTVKTVLGNPSNFMVRLPAGEYRSAITGLPGGYTLKSILAADMDLTSENLRISTDSAAPELTITIGAAPATPWARVGGRVTNVATRIAERGGQVGPGKFLSPPAAVLLVSKKLSEHWFAPIGPDGTFEFARVLPGSYELRGFPDSVATPALKLTVPASANTTDLQIVLPDVRAAQCANC